MKSIKKIILVKYSERGVDLMEQLSFIHLWLIIITIMLWNITKYLKKIIDLLEKKLNE